jgi:PAS domain S-box-containing protein
MLKYELFALTPTTVIEEIIANMSEAFFLVDLNDQILFCNSMGLTLLNCRKEEIINHSYLSIFQNTTFNIPELQLEMFDLLKLPEVIHNLEITLTRNDGKKIPLAVSKSKIVDNFGHHSGYLFLLNDLTQIRKTEEERLEEHDKVSREFIGKFSHELRNPMNAIIGFANLLRDQQLGDLNSPQVDCLNDIYNSAVYLLALINEILEYAKLSNGTQQLHFEWFKLKTIIDLIEPQIKQLNQIKKHQINYQIDSLEIHFFSCIIKIEQVLMNLLSNAIKFTPPIGQITLTIRMLENEMIYFEVKDNGIGIKEQDKPKLFQKFSRFQSNIEGTGLGLLISKQIITNLGGDLQFESEYGKGTRFFFSIPLKLTIEKKEEISFNKEIPEKSN